MSSNTPRPTDAPGTRKIPLEVFTLGIVSFLTDVSSEAIFAVLPIYFVGVIGGSAVALGVMEGLADFAASSLDLASGYLSDRTGKRKRLALSGYAFSTLAKTLLLLVSSATGVAAFRIVERLGKSVRGAPRDALLASVAPKEKRGASFGIHKAFDKAGAVIGPGLAYLALTALGSQPATFHGIFAAALIPAVVATVVLGVFVKDRAVAAPRRLNMRQTLASLGPRYRRYLTATAIFSLGYFSFAFLLLKANAAGFEAQDQALLYGLFNLVFAIVSVPIGRLGDRLGRRTIVVFSYVIYAGMAVGFWWAESRVAITLLFVVYGVFYAMDEGQAKAYLADLSEDDTRATAIGIYGFVTGLIYLPASLIAGALWAYNPTWTFAFAAGTSLCALAVFLLSFKPTRVHVK